MLIRRENVVPHTRAQIKIQLSPAWPTTIWPRNQILNQIIFSYGTFNPLLFYSLAVPQIYCGSGGLAVSHLSHFPEWTHTHLVPIRRREWERMPISSLWHRYTLRTTVPRSFCYFCVVYKLVCHALITWFHLTERESWIWTVSGCPGGKWPPLRVGYIDLWH